MNQVTRLMSPPLTRFQEFAETLLEKGVILVDHEHSITWASRTALRLHGIDGADELGATVADYIEKFRLDHIGPLASITGRGTVSDLGLCEGRLRMSRSCDGNSPVCCNVQLLEISDEATDRSSTAIILWLEGSQPEMLARLDKETMTMDQYQSMQAGADAVVFDALRPTISSEPHTPERPALSKRYTTASHHEIGATARIICAASPVPLHMLDAGLRVLGVSDAWLAWLGYNAASVIGRDIGLFMEAETRARFEQHAWARQRDARSTEIACHFLKQSGEPVEAVVTTSCTMNEAGELAFATCVPVERTGRQHDASLLSLFAQSPVPTLWWQLDSLKVLDANPMFHEFVGQAAGTLAGQSLDNLAVCGTKAARQKLEQELRLSGVAQRRDVQMRAPTGEMLTCSFSATTIHLSGYPCGVLMLQDVTERRRDEAQLFEAIEAVMKDSAWFSRSVIEKLAALRLPPKTSGRHAELADLTRREREVLKLISVGLCDLDIARQLGLTRSTVRNHVATLYSKIDVHSRSAAIVWARERGVNLTMNKPAPRDAGRSASL